MFKLMPLPLVSFIFLSCFWSSLIEAATVKGIVKDKFVAIDAGSDAGFTQKTRVCFFEKETRIACGIIVQAKANRSFARLTPENLKKIKKGMSVRLFENGGTSTASTPASTPASPMDSNEPKDKKGVKGATNLKLAYILTPKAPATYHAVSYFAPYDLNGDAQRVSTLWDRDRDITTSVLGFGLELGFGVGSSKLTLGGRTRIYKGTIVKSFYDDQSTNFAETRMSGSAVGAWTDFYYLSLDFGKLSVDMGNGLDVDISQVKMTLEQKSDLNSTVAELVNYNSSLTVVSLRTNLVFNLFFNPMGLQFGTFFTFPLTSSGSQTVSVKDPQVDSYLQDLTGEADIIDAIDHRASGFGIELFFSAYYAF